jgi:DNA (cytosine-5)-methyltransferase 1
MLVLSLFPGIGLLDMAFEEILDCCIVRGPDLLWGGTIQNFHPPAGKFSGVIGGPPCQAHSTYAALNRAQGKNVAEDLVPEFLRCVDESQPDWFAMENAPGVQDVALAGYHCPKPVIVDNRDFGEEQARVRKWQFGFKNFFGQVHVEPVALHRPRKEPACLASEGRSGRLTTVRIEGKSRTRHNPRRTWSKFCELQGLPEIDLPFTNEWKYRVVGNGVPLPMGRAIARAIKEALNSSAAGCCPRGKEHDETAG